MNLNEANSLPAVAISGFLILGAIGFLIFWALQTAYVG
jgi:preprotein translocase subunit Sss1